MPTVEALIEDDETVDQAIEMDNLFKEHGIDDSDAEETVVEGNATLWDFAVRNHRNDDALSLNLFFRLPNDQFGKYSTVIYSFHDENTPFVQHLLNNQLEQGKISDVLGHKISISRQTPESKVWTGDSFNIELTEIEVLPDWDSSHRANMEDRLQKHLQESNRPTKTCGTATIIDYYVRRSANNIQQDLEIGLKFRLHTGEIKAYECIHDSDHPDDGFEQIRHYFDNPEEIRELLQEELPTIYNSDEDQWEIHIPSQSILSTPLFLFERTGIKFASNTRRIPFGKTYGNATDLRDCWNSENTDTICTISN